MESILKILVSIRRGKVLMVLNPILNILFISSITYSICKYFYPTFGIPTEIQLQPTIEYFLNGDFIIPSGIFLLLWTISSFLFEILFLWINSLITSRINRCFQKIFLNPETEINDITNSTKISNIPNWVMEIYKNIRNSINDSKKTQINQLLNISKIDLSYDFILLWRSIIVVTMFFVQVNYFGWILYGLILVTQIVMIVKILIGYQVIVFIPIFYSKLKNNKEVANENELKKPSVSI